MNNLVVTILAAGDGKRMLSDIPKVLILFEGKPILVRIIENVMKINPTKIIVITGKYDELIKKTLSEYITYDNIQFVKQDVPMGTGDAIKCCLPYYGDNDRILILNGDMPLINNDIIMQFIDNCNQITILTARLWNPSGYGRIVYKDNEFIKITEDKDCNNDELEINVVNTGLYFINSDILHTYIPMICNNNNKQEYYLTDIVKIIKDATNISINTYLLDEKYNMYISGVNTPKELTDLEYAFRTFT